MDFRNFQRLDSKPSLLAYGCMRFPERDGQIDKKLTYAMLDAAVAGGVNYFDSAYVYHGGKSEGFMGEYFTARSMPRESYYIATKLPQWNVDSLEDAKRIFEEQLTRWQTDYIDFYLLHDLKSSGFEKMLKLGVVDYCLDLQKQGKIKHFGFSTHDNFEGFKSTLDYRDWDFVMLHLNYMDLDNLKLYEYALSKDIPILVMEGVKGGSLSKLPEDISKYFANVKPTDSPSKWALRWAGSLEGVKCVLSGMSSVEQVKDNLTTFSDFKPLTDDERAAIKKVETALRKRVRCNCTGCNYCMPCPAGVNIPWVLSIWNNWGIYENRGHSNWEWSIVKGTQRPDSCTECGACVELCPQKIDLITDLKKAQSELEGLKW